LYIQKWRGHTPPPPAQYWQCSAFFSSYNKVGLLAFKMCGAAPCSKHPGRMSMKEQILVPDNIVGKGKMKEQTALTSINWVSDLREDVYEGADPCRS
jgi:hypothetical protein